MFFISNWPFFFRGQCEYELVLKTDLYTNRHTQWYYFRVQNAVPGVVYKFRIVNLLKKDSLYNYGQYSDTISNIINEIIMVTFVLQIFTPFDNFICILQVWLYSFVSCKMTPKIEIHSLDFYSLGMRPLLYSESDAKNKSKGWIRAGHHIR